MCEQLSKEIKHDMLSVRVGSGICVKVGTEIAEMVRMLIENKEQEMLKLSRIQVETDRLHSRLNFATCLNRCNSIIVPVEVRTS